MKKCAAFVFHLHTLHSYKALHKCHQNALKVKFPNKMIFTWLVHQQFSSTAIKNRKHFSKGALIGSELNVHDMQRQATLTSATFNSRTWINLNFSFLERSLACKGHSTQTDTTTVK